MKFKKIKQRGQALVLYAILMPLLFLCVGVGLDLGWYYLNVSRLQNAADAAALAGARALVEKNRAFESYYVVRLASNQLPPDFENYEKVYTHDFGTLYSYKTLEQVTDTLKAGRDLAEEYVRKNLSDEETVDISATYQNNLSATDGWSTEADSAVKGTVELKYKLVDGKNDVLGPLYYVVSLEEKIRHFLLPGWFEDMDAPVRAVVLLQPHDKGLIMPMETLARTKVIDNWEYSNKYLAENGEQISGGKWNHYQAAPGLSGGSNKGIKYTSGNTYRTESVTVRTQDKNKDSTSSGTTTAANGNKFYSESEVDSINIDFRAEVTGKFKSDWDLGYDFPETGHKYQFAEGWSATDGADKRIHFNADFDQSFRTRDPSKEADPLWVRIESDPLKNPYTGAGVSNFNSVRQITLNFNDDNTKVATNSDGSKYYEKRPYVIFYTGPENIDYTTDANGVLIRHSQPVVLNLNENLNAIIYMPESPVIINGNGNEFHGFVIAKCYLQSVTEEDMTNGFERYDGFNKPEPFSGNFKKGTDGNNYTVYFKPDKLSTKEQIDAAYPNATIITDEKGNVTVMDKIDAPKRLLLNYTKADSNTYEVKYENGTHDENATFANYVNSTYKEQFKKLSKLDDSKITAITFPDEDYNETTATYYVATSDLSNNQTNANYVKVLVDGAEKYVDKANLPYVKVRFNANYFYVCVADLQLLKDANGNKNGNKGVRMVDTTDGDKDIYVNPTSIDQYGDSWKIDRAYYDTNGNWKNWTKDKVEFSADGSYFMLKSEINNDPQVVGKYKKITTHDAQGKEVVKYLKNDNDLEYYTKVDNNKDADGNVINYIIVDKNGNMLTKTLTPPDVFDVKTQSTNETMKDDFVKTEDGSPVNSSPQGTYSSGSEALSNYWNTYTRNQKEVPHELPLDKNYNEEALAEGNYRGNAESHKEKDYRIPALERVYKADVAFNLSTDSCYSYFGIEELWRIDYIYLDVDEINKEVLHPLKTADYNWKVDDMFFTYERAEWID